MNFFVEGRRASESEMVIIFKVRPFELSAVEIDDLHTDAEHKRHKGIENGSDDDCGDFSGDKYSRDTEEHLATRPILNNCPKIILGLTGATS